LTITVRSAKVQDARTDCPHDDAEREKADTKDGVIDRGFFSSLVAPFPVSIKDDN